MRQTRLATVFVAAALAGACATPNAPTPTGPAPLDIGHIAPVPWVTVTFAVGGAKPNGGYGPIEGATVTVWWHDHVTGPDGTVSFPVLSQVGDGVTTVSAPGYYPRTREPFAGRTVRDGEIIYVDLEAVR